MRRTIIWQEAAGWCGVVYHAGQFVAGWITPVSEDLIRRWADEKGGCLEVCNADDPPPAAMEGGRSADRRMAAKTETVVPELREGPGGQPPGPREDRNVAGGQSADAEAPSRDRLEGSH